MARKTKPLSDVGIRRAKVPDGKRDLTLYDGDGLTVRVLPSGSKTFYLEYKHPHTRKNRRMKLGRFGDLSLSQARKMASEARALLSHGIDPAEHYKAMAEAKAAERRAANPTLRELAERWHREKSPSWATGHARDIWQRLEKHLLPYIGNVPVKELTLQHFLSVLKRIEEKGRIDTLKRIRQYADGIMRYAVTFGLAPHNPLSDLDNRIFRKADPKNYPHVTDPAELRGILLAIDEYRGDKAIHAALQMLPHVALRPGELARLEWEQIDFDRRLIDIPAHIMKKKRPHLVPMSDWVYEHLQGLYALWGDTSPYVFPSPRTLTRPISEQSLNAAMSRIGFKGIQCAHGFRHTASTLLNEMGFNGDWVEMMLAHLDKNSIRGTYNKAQYIEERARMMQHWSRWLVNLKESHKVIPLFKAG